VTGGPSTSQILSLTNPAPRVVGPLSTSGSQILDGNVPARPVVLKGIDATNDGYEAVWDNDPTGYYGALNPGLLTPAAVGNLYRWGANTVRIMLSSDLYLQNCPGETYPVSQAAYAADVQKEVNLVTSFGMVAVVTLAGVNPKQPNGNCYDPPIQASDKTGYVQYGGPAPLPPAADATAFFHDLASHLGTNPLVAFELFNEPNVCELTQSNGTQSDVPWTPQCPQAQGDQGWANDGTMVVQGGLGAPVTYAAAGMKTLYNSVRQNGAASNLVFVDSNHFASDPKTFDSVCATSGCAWQGPTNLVYVFHYYDCQPDGSTSTKGDCSDGTPETCATINGNLAAKLVDRARWPAPVDFNEFSWPQYETSYVYGTNSTPLNAYGHGLYVNNVIAYLDAHGISWGLFAYENDTAVHNVWQGPYATVTAGDTVPWSATANAQAAINDMSGTTAQCTDPPSGYG